MSDQEFTVELVLDVRAPSLAAAEAIATQAAAAAQRTNVRIRDGRIANVIVADVRNDEDEAVE